jgi:peptidase E
VVGVTRTPPTIVALGGGGFSMEPRNPRLDDYVLSLARRRRPRVCFVPTASGDSSSYVDRFLRAFPRRRAETSCLRLFRRDARDVRRALLANDVVYVGGGNTANLLAIWRLHRVDRALREAWRRGIVLCGVSAGALCWFEAGVTDSFGPRLAPLHDGLGLLRGSFCPHYDGERLRRPTYRRLVASRAVPEGYAADDGAALVFRGRALTEVVASRPDAQAYRVARTGETPIATRCLRPRVATRA